MVVIEMNPRVSRSSALASKATGFPIAKVAAKLAVGYTLDELANDITGGATPASFEPSIDYVVTKIPRFAFEKFPQADARLTTQMKSVGEVMAIGRTFQESLQKALRGLETGPDGLESICRTGPEAERRAHRELINPGAERIWHRRRCLPSRHERGGGHTSTPASTPGSWCRSRTSSARRALRRGGLPRTSMRTSCCALKRKGFSDGASRALGSTEAAVRERRHELGIRPVYKRVDTCAAEFASSTAYMYSTYDEECEAEPTDGARSWSSAAARTASARASSSTTAAVHAAFAMREDGYETIMVNCNPETVSTDYDTSDRLYFEPVTLEDVLEIVDKEQPKGVIVQFGGQTPLKLARALEAAGVPIIGTSPDAIDRAEDRERFQQLIHELDLLQPPNTTVRSVERGRRGGAEIGYPLVVRPSYVLGGRAMEIVYAREDLLRYMREAVSVSDEAPVLLDRFLERRDRGRYRRGLRRRAGGDRRRSWSISSRPACTPATRPVRCRPTACRGGAGRDARAGAADGAGAGRRRA
jgi:carbamoyl-phosphate synthase large subunit